MIDGNSETGRRILFLARGGMLDGAERQLCYLAAGLDRRRFVPIVLMDRDGPMAAHLQSLGVECRVMPMHAWRSFPSGLLRYVDAARMARLAANRGVAFVHASDLWKSRYALFIARRLGAPCVIHVRGPVPKTSLAKHGLLQASGIIAIALRYRDDMLNAGVTESHVRVIDDAVDIARFHPNSTERPAIRARWGVGARVTVGIIGRIEPFKRILEFLEMAAAVQKQRPGAAAYFVIGQPGPQQYQHQIRAAILRLGLTPHVTFIERTDDINTVMSGLDIVATMSGGSVMFEAMAAGKALLSIRTDERASVHTRHGHTAWCVTTDSADIAAAALLHLLADADLRLKLGMEARRWVEEHLLIKDMVARVQDFYDELLGP